jgi:hypothetical protein
MSFSIPHTPSFCREATARPDMLFVASAGNNGTDAFQWLNYPAAYDGVLSVGAVDCVNEVGGAPFHYVFTFLFLHCYKRGRLGAAAKAAGMAEACGGLRGARASATRTWRTTGAPNAVARVPPAARPLPQVQPWSQRDVRVDIVAPGERAPMHAPRRAAGRTRPGQPQPSSPTQTAQPIVALRNRQPVTTAAAGAMSALHRRGRHPFNIPG